VWSLQERSAETCTVHAERPWTSPTLLRRTRFIQFAIGPEKQHESLWEMEKRSVQIRHKDHQQVQTEVVTAAAKNTAMIRKTLPTLRQPQWSAYLSRMEEQA
jgi:hypothetical protein